MNGLLSQWRAGLTGRRVITWYGSITALLGLWISTIAFNLPNNVVSEARWDVLATDASLTVVAGFGALGVGWLILRTLTVPYPIWCTVTIFAIVGAIRFLGISELPWDRNVEGQFWATHLAISIASAIIWLSLPAAALAAFDRHQQASARLSIRQAELVAQRATVSDAIANELSRLAAMVSDVVVARLDHLREAAQRLMQSDATPPQVREFGSELRDCSNSIVRPISHELAEVSDQSCGFVGDSVGTTLHSASNSVVPEVEPRGSSEPAMSLILNSATVIRPFAPVPTVGFIALLALPGSLHLFGAVRGVLVPAVGLVGVYVVLELADRFLTERLRRLSSKRRLAIVLLVYALAGLVLASVAPFLKSGVPMAYWLWWASVLLVMAVASFSWSALAAVGYRWRSVEASLRATVAATGWENRRLTADLASARLRMADLLHGQVQGGLTASAMQLEWVAGIPKAEYQRQVANALGNVETTIDGAIDAVAESEREPLATPNSDETLAAGLNELRRAWQGGVDVSVIVEDQAASIADELTSRASAVLVVAREAVTNASRHGTASMVQIRVALDGNQLTIRCDDDGTGCDQGENHAGYGLSQIAGLGNWVMGPSPLGGCQLLAAIPFA